MSLKAIEERASEWLARRDSGNWSDVDQTDLNDWLRASTAHRVAYLRLEAAWQVCRWTKFHGLVS
jgi:transmembrane sensor